MSSVGFVPDVSALVVNYNTQHLIAPCIDALRASAAAAGATLQIVIVDNASRDGSAEILRRDFADCNLVFNTVNVGFGRANNQALERADGRYVLLLNTDAFVAADSIAAAAAFMDRNADCGLLGVRLVGRDGVLQPSCRYFPTPWNEFLARTGLARWFPGTRTVDDMSWDHATARECDWVPGCFYLVRRETIKQVGLFDPRFFLYYEEVDHCRAVKSAGWRVMYCPDTTVVHIGGESAKSEAPITASGRQIDALQVESGMLYHRKHHGAAGLVAVVVLGLVADALSAGKGLLSRRDAAGFSVAVRRLRTTWKLLVATRFGRRATR